MHEYDDDRDDSRQDAAKEDETGTQSRKYQEVRAQGLSLYVSMNSLFFVGCFRMLPSRSFSIELMIGYAIEIVFNLFPMFFVQMFNNSDMPGLLTGLQSASLIFKVFLILTFIIELIMILWEIVLNRKMRKL